MPRTRGGAVFAGAASQNLLHGRDRDRFAARFERALQRLEREYHFEAQA